jgi:enoyl-CoA hydratase/carnithine racemase
MSEEVKGNIEVEDHGAILVARIDGGTLGVFGNDIAERLAELVDRADEDPDVQAVVFTGKHPERFVSHIEIRWLQEGGAAIPPLGVKGTTAIAQTARGVNRVGGLKGVLGTTPLWPAVQLERIHQTFLKMNSSGVIFVAAMNGSALGLGAEFAWANDLRVLAEGDYFIGQPEVLLGIIPGGGGTQRLTRLVGTHRSLTAILEGKPFSGPEALALGAIDDLVPKDKVLDRAIELARHFGSRPKEARGAVKRTVYFGGSETLPDGLRTEHGEFLHSVLAQTGQELMLDYMANTEKNGELPLYIPGVFEQVLEQGTTRGAGANGPALTDPTGSASDAGSQAK